MKIKIEILNDERFVDGSLRGNIDKMRTGIDESCWILNRTILFHVMIFMKRFETDDLASCGNKVTRLVVNVVSLIYNNNILKKRLDRRICLRKHLTVEFVA